MNTMLMAAAGYILGAMPFSLWLGLLLARVDIRQVGDGNPGAANAFKAGGWKLGVPALLLDFLKGAAPVAVANFALGLDGWRLAAVALAPVVGHAFSVFEGFRGGKALAVTFGVWAGLTLAEVPLVLGALFALLLALQTASAWAVALGMFGLLVYLLARGSDAALLAVWAGNTALLLWKHRADLHEPTSPRPWLSGARRKHP